VGKNPSKKGVSFLHTLKYRTGKKRLVWRARGGGGASGDFDPTMSPGVTVDGGGVKTNKNGGERERVKKKIREGATRVGPENTFGLGGGKKAVKGGEETCLVGGIKKEGRRKAIKGEPIQQPLVKRIRQRGCGWTQTCQLLTKETVTERSKEVHFESLETGERKTG